MLDDGREVTVRPLPKVTAPQVEEVLHHVALSILIDTTATVPR